MDPAEEQAMEIEALEAILMDDLVRFEGKIPDGWPSDRQVFSVIISPLEDGDTDREKAPALLQMLFAHTDEYPGEPPLVKLRSEKGLSDARVAKAVAVVEEQMEELAGMPMIYNLITAAREWLVAAVSDEIQDDADEPEHVKARKREERELKEREQQPAKQCRSQSPLPPPPQRAHGHVVTPESFAEWKARFDAEMALEKAKVMDVKAHEEKMRRPTGREWFEGGKGGKDEPALEDGDEDGIGDDRVGSDDEDFLDEYSEDDKDWEDDEDEDEDEEDDEDFLDELGE